MATLTTLVDMKLLTLTEQRAFRVWESGLSDLSEHELRRGLRKALDWTGGYFHLPAFRKLCKLDADDLGYPSVRDAYALATCGRRIELPKPAAMAVSKIGRFDFDRMSRFEGFRAFQDAYQSAVATLVESANDQKLMLPNERQQNAIGKAI